MSLPVAALELMLEKGLTLADVVEIARIFDADAQPIEPSANALRTRRYRERFANAGAIDWEATRLTVFERDKWTCVYCGATDAPLHCDHSTPLIQGGLNETDNLVTACVDCNRAKSGRTPGEWLDA